MMSVPYKSGVVLAVSLVLQSSLLAAATWIPAFPGAEGSGASSVGGRGGPVIEVTNLNDSGPGSFRAAVDTAGARIVVFRVGGTIELLSTVLFTNPYITIAGQTAPGGGIAFKNTYFFNRYTDPSATFDIRTHNVIIRHVRLRAGPRGEVDPVQIYSGAYGIILDHCSLSWAVDETLSSWNDPYDCTIQWCILSEGLRNSTHSEGPHSMGPLLGSEGCTRMTLHHNLFAHNDDRNPRLKTSGVCDVVNNVAYNYGENAALFSSDYAVIPVNYIGNLVKPGPNSSGGYEVVMWEIGGQPLSVYVHGNIGPHRADDTQPQQNVVEPVDRVHLTNVRHDCVPVRTTTAAIAYDQVLAGAGATLPVRDSADLRVVADVRNGTGEIIDDPADVGGWPAIADGVPPVDTDHDGMPDTWETQHSLDPDDPSDGADDDDHDIYTNVEEYLNGTDPRKIPLCGVQLVAYAGGAPTGATMTTAAVGKYYRTDRAYSLTSLPPAYACAVMIPYAETDGSFDGDDFIRVSLTANATVAVAYDSRATTLPDWLSGWTPTGETLTGLETGTSGQTVSFNVRTKPFSAGQTAILGGNRQAGGDGPAAYLLIVVPDCPRPVPIMTQFPESRLVYRGTTIQLTAQATGAGVLSWQWQKNGAELANQGHYSGVYTSTLTVTGIDFADAGAYRVVVSDDGCATVSSQAQLTLATPCDYDGDDDVDQVDFGHFQACVGTPFSQAGCENTRLNAGPDVDAADFVIFQQCMSGPNAPAEPRCLPEPS